MFCKSCGAKNVDDARYCTVCGADLQATPAQPQAPQQENFAQPQAPQQENFAQPQGGYYSPDGTQPGGAQPNNAQPQGGYYSPNRQQPNGGYSQPGYASTTPNTGLFGQNLKFALQTFFSANMTKNLGTVAASTTFEGVLFSAAYVLSFGISVAVIILNLIKSALGEYASYITGSSGINFGLLFTPAFGGILITAAATVGCTYLLTFIGKINGIKFTSVINVVGYSYIPLILVCIANMLVSLVLPKVVIALFIIGLILHLFLLYIGIQRLGKPGGLFAAWFSVIMGIVIYLGVVIVFEFYNSAITDLVGGSLDDISDIFELLS